MSDRPRVLVADADAGRARVLRDRLDQLGYAVDVHTDGPSAWQAMSAEAPGLAVLDNALPGLSGIDVIRLMRQYRRLHGVPAIAIVPPFKTDQLDAAVAAGADDFVVAPFGVHEIAQRVALRLAAPVVVPAP